MYLFSPPPFHGDSNARPPSRSDDIKASFSSHNPCKFDSCTGWQGDNPLAFAASLCRFFASSHFLRSLLSFSLSWGKVRYREEACSWKKERKTLAEKEACVRARDHARLPLPFFFACVSPLFLPRGALRRCRRRLRKKGGKAPFPPIFFFPPSFPPLSRIFARGKEEGKK